jgi:S-adenosylmethionine hydrolase
MNRLVFLGILLLAAINVEGADLQAKVTGITEDYGNIDTDVSLEQLVELDIKPGDSFVVTFGDHQVTAKFGASYGDVPRGEWIALFTELEKLRIARNLENAANTIGIAAGDLVTISQTVADPGRMDNQAAD